MFLTVDQAAEKLQTTRGVVKSMIKAKRLKATRLSATQIRIKEEDLASLISAEPAKPRARAPKKKEAAKKPATNGKSVKPQKEATPTG